MSINKIAMATFYDDSLEWFHGNVCDSVLQEHFPLIRNDILQQECSKCTATQLRDDI